MNHFVKILATLLLAAVVFGAAKYLDQNPRRVVIKEIQETAAAKVETTEQTEATVPTETEEMVPTETTVSTEPAEQQDRFVLTFVGDCTLGSGQFAYNADVGFVRTLAGDYGYPFRNVISYFENDDVTFVNLEGPLTDNGNPADKKHVFRGPQSFVQILSKNSVEFASLANNHTNDYGENGYNNTRDTLDNAGVQYVERDMSTLITLDSGLKIGVYGMVYYNLDVEDMTQEIRTLKEQGADLIIVAAHWGNEGSYRIAPLQSDVGHAAIDAGADIVWGTHPHVLQPIEEYKDGVIYYSLGNFSFGGNTALRDYDSAIVCQEIIRDEQGNVSVGEYTIVPVSVSSMEYGNNFQPIPYEPDAEGYDRVLQKLGGTWTGLDLPIQ